MLKMKWYCSGCNSEGDVENPSEICGGCPKCTRHRGEVEYSCDMTVEEFLTELTKMSESEIAKNAYAIQECANDLIDKL